MRIINYITSENADFVNLEKVIGESYQIIRSDPENLQIDPGSCDLVLVNSDIELHHLINLLTNFYSMFDFVDIPIILAAGESYIGPFNKQLPPGISGVIAKPFQGDQTSRNIDQFLLPVGTTPCADKLVTLFCQALISVIETNLEQTPIQTALYTKKNYLLFGDISASMELSEGLKGSIAVAFPRELAVMQAEKMTACNRSDLDEHIIFEGVGEIINQIAGKAMTIGSLTGVDFSISLPDIKAQAGRKLGHNEDAGHQVILFELYGQPLALHLCLEQTAKLAPQPQTVSK